jgi:hypothetical protein
MEAHLQAPLKQGLNVMVPLRVKGFDTPHIITSRGGRVEKTAAIWNSGVADLWPTTVGFCARFR